MKKTDEIWLKRYNLAENYYKNFHNLHVPKIFKTLDGIHYDDNGFGLGEWLYAQRDRYLDEKLSKERYELLLKIGMDFNKKSRTRLKTPHLVF